MKKVLVLLLMVVISVFAVAGCSSEKEKIVRQATVVEERVEIGGLNNYKGNVAIITVGKKAIKAEELNISTEDLRLALQRDRVFAVGLHMDNEYDVNFINMLFLRDCNFRSATQDESEISSDYFDRTVENTSNSYYWFVK